MRSNDLFTTFFAVWVVIGLGLWVFHKRTSYARKRQWYFWLITGTGLLFICFVYLMFEQPEALYLAVPAVAAISFLTYRLTRVCPRCGFRIPPRDLLSRTGFCPRCGQKLDDDAQPR